ncbi:MAG: hypothetical protein KAS32_04330 [Candidatus Peribacteraceae bacterium]|nr:hypothetical protein [Candidatus Peribacteraceae bacterium]
MKHLITITCVVMMLCGTVFGQYSPLIHNAPHIDITLTGNQTQVVYVLFPDDRGTWYVSQTLPTAAYAGSSVGRDILKGYITLGHNYLVAESNLTSGTIDSIGCVAKPLYYETKDKEFSVGNDSTWLVFDGIGSYSSASSSYITPTNTTPFSTLLTGLLWPVAGAAFHFKQSDIDADAMVTVLTVMFKNMRAWR